MRIPGPPIPIRTLPHDIEAPADLPVVELRMSAHDRRRVRRLVEAPDGAVLALELATGTILHPGQLLHHNTEAAYVVSAADEDVLYVFVSNEACAAEIEAIHTDDFALAAEHVLNQPVRCVNVIPYDFSDLSSP